MTIPSEADREREIADHFCFPWTPAHKEMREVLIAYGTEREAAGVSRGLKLVADWMIQHGFVTGHGDTIEDLLGELAAALPNHRPDPSTEDNAT